jgi:flagellar hook-associated protein 2
MGITAAGVGSGLDIEGIVSQLMRLERRPLDALEQKESDTRDELSAYGRLKSAISTFQSAMDGLSDVEKFQIYKVDSTDEEVLSATANSSAANGMFSIDIQRLAQNHKVSSGEFADTATFGSAGDVLSIGIGDDTVDITFGGAVTLAELRDAINDADDNPGVTASLLNTGGGNQRLILTSQESGAENQMSLDYSGSIAGNPFGFATANRDELGDPLANLGLLDAAFTVDGFDVTSASNNASGVVDGLTLDLKQLGTADIVIERDTASITASMQKFVDAYNSLQNTIKSLSDGDLSGDGLLRSVQGQLRSVMNTAPAGLDSSFVSLGELGVATEKDGGLSFDANVFKDALAADFSGVAQLLANDDQGYAFRFSALADELQDNDGLIDTREDSLNDRLSDLSDRQEDWEYRLELIEKRMRSQYSALDTLVGQLQSTSQFLFQQLGV